MDIFTSDKSSSTFSWHGSNIMSAVKQTDPDIDVHAVILEKVEN